MDDLGAVRREGLGEAAAIVAQGLRRSPLSPVWLAVVVTCIDLPVFAVALWFAQYGATSDAAFAPLAAIGWALGGAALAVVLLALSQGYAPRHLRHARRSIANAAAALAGPAILVTGLHAQDAPGSALVAALAALVGAVVPLRAGVATATAWAVETGLLQRRAVIAGGGEHAMDLIRGLARRVGNDIHLYGIFDDRDDLRSPIQVLGVPKIGGYDDLIDFARRSEIDLVIVALPAEAGARIDWLLDALRVLPVEVRLSTYSRDYAFPPPGRDPLVAAIRRSFAPERRLTKRVFDLVIGTLALAALLPVMLAAALAIRLDTPGPILFRQRRHGYNNRVIDVLKFRSMHHADADPAARRVVSRDDPRVTRVGRFLRRSSIDELPQLWNVLRGDLSLVGPRPHAVDARSSGQERFERIVHGYSARHRLPPGITGWAQVNGWRGEIDDPAKLAARFEHDLWYIENWSPWLDLRILLRTPLSLLDTRSAY